MMLITMVKGGTTSITKRNICSSLICLEGRDYKDIEICGLKLSLFDENISEVFAFVHV